MKKKYFMLVAACLMAAIFSLSACNRQTGGSEFDKWIADIGVEYTIPVLNFSAKDVTTEVYNSDNNALEVKYGKVVFPTVGKYKIVYRSGKKSTERTVTAVDTLAPQFDQVFDGYYGNIYEANKKVELTGYIGDKIDLKKFFRAVDNSGTCTVTYEALRGGEKPAEITDGIFLAERADYYTLTATAVDANGNSTKLWYHMYMYERGMFESFDFRNSYSGRWLYDSTDGSASQSNEASLYLRANEGFSSDITCCGEGQSYYMTFDSVMTANTSTYSLLIQPDRLPFDFTEVKKISYSVYIESDDITDGTAIPDAVIPYPTGVDSSKAVGLDTATVGKWNEIVITNPGLSGKAMIMYLKNAWPEAKNYRLYLDNIRVELPPEIAVIKDTFSFAANSTVDVAELGASAFDRTTGLPVSLNYKVIKSDGTQEINVTDGKFTLGGEGGYLVTIAATSPYGHTAEKTVFIIAGTDDVAPVIALNTDYSADKGYFLEVPKGKRLRVKDFIAEVTDNFDGAIAVSDIKVVNKSGSTVNLTTGSNGVLKYEYFTTAAGEEYIVNVTATDRSGNEAIASVSIFVTDELSVGDMDLLDVNDANQGLWVNNVTHKNHNYSHSTFSKYGFGYSYKASNITGVAEIGLFNTIPNETTFNAVKMRVYIESPEFLTNEQLKALTPKPKDGTAYTCNTYPQARNQWVEVTYVFNSAETHNTWISGGAFVFGGTAKDDIVTVYMDEIVYLSN